MMRLGLLALDGQEGSFEEQTSGDCTQQIRRRSYVRGFMLESDARALSSRLKDKIIFVMRFPNGHIYCSDDQVVKEGIIMEMLTDYSTASNEEFIAIANMWDSTTSMSSLVKEYESAKFLIEWGCVEVIVAELTFRTTKLFPTIISQLTAAHESGEITAKKL